MARPARNCLRVVGTIAGASRCSRSSCINRHLQQAFEDAILVALAIATIAALVTALAASWLLAQRLTRPIRTLAHAAGRIGRGSYQARVPVPPSGDELAAQGRAFNQMAAALEATERHRQALLADLAHELRTPLATLEAYVEGLADGVVAADQEAWTVLQAELDRLRRLTEDLTAVSRPRSTSWTCARAGSTRLRW